MLKIRRVLCRNFQGKLSRPKPRKQSLYLRTYTYVGQRRTYVRTYAAEAEAEAKNPFCHDAKRSRSRASILYPRLIIQTACNDSATCQDELDVNGEIFKVTTAGPCLFVRRTNYI